MPVAMRSEWGAKVAIAATCKRDITAAKGVISGARPWDTAIWSGCTTAGAPWAREWAQFSAHSAQDWAAQAKSWAQIWAHWAQNWAQIWAQNWAQWAQNWAGFL